MQSQVCLVLLSWFCMWSHGGRVDYDRWGNQEVLSGLCYYGNNVECCWGWRQTNGGRCQPHCQQGCKHGECVGPDRCRCHPGYTGKACNQDLNECGVKPRPCKHRCMNTLGSYKCYCLDGYTLQADGSCRNARTCYHANCQYGCKVTKGAVQCTCPSPGLRLGPDRRTCVDVNECVSGGGVCPHRRKCVNTFGSFMCRCHLGFKLTYINGRYSCIDKDSRPFCSLNPASPKCKCKDGSCEAVLKVTLEPHRPRTTKTTTTPTTATTTLPAPATTTSTTTAEATTPVSTVTTTIPATTTPVTTTTPATATPVTTTIPATTTPVTTTTPATTTPVTTTTLARTTLVTTTTPATTTPVTTTTSATTTPVTTTTPTPATTTTVTTTTPTTVLSTTPAATTTLSMTTSSFLHTTPQLDTTTPPPPPTTTTTQTTTTRPSTTTPSTPLSTTTTLTNPTTTTIRLPSTTSLSTSTVSNRINKEVTHRQRGDVHIPRHPGQNQVWEFDIELGNTAEDTKDDPEVGVLRCTFDHGMCDWMSDKEGDVHWETAQNTAGDRYLSVPDLKAGQRSTRGARLVVQIVPPWSHGDLCFSFSHWLTGHHVGVLQLFVRKSGRGQRYDPALWSRTGGHGWRHTQVSLTMHEVDKVLLKADRRRGQRGQIAVDDVTLRRGACQ